MICTYSTEIKPPLNYFFTQLNVIQNLKISQWLIFLVQKTWSIVMVLKSVISPPNYYISLYNLYNKLPLECFQGIFEILILNYAMK